VKIEIPADLGFGVQIESFSQEPARMVLRHPAEGGTPCFLTVKFATPAATATRPPGEVLYEVQSWEPLTVIQPFECRQCGHRGRIQGGVWVPG
jgi:hypothetical protein